MPSSSRLKIVEVVVDGVETVPTGLDDEVVQRHLEGSRTGGPRQVLETRLVDDEQETGTPDLFMLTHGSDGNIACSSVKTGR
jgi:hypothetical protein